MTDTLVPDSPFAIPNELPTIAVVHPTDSTQSIIINAEDFDPNVHQRWSDKLQPAATKTTSDGGETSAPEPKKRGRTPKAATAIAPAPEPKKRGRTPKAATAIAPAPEPKKRGRTPKSTSPTIAAVPEPETPTEILVDAAVSVPAGAAERLAALEAMDASEVKEIATKHGIPRPRAGGWKAAIPRIVAVEFPEDEPATG